MKQHTIHTTGRYAATRAPSWLTTGRFATGTKILLVDDNPDICKFVEFYLSSVGIELTSIGDGIDALWHIEETAPADVVLLDRGLPGCNGELVLRKIRITPGWNAVPVVGLSANCDPAVVENFLASGADFFIPKPFSPVQLLSELHRQLNKEPTLSESPRIDSRIRQSGSIIAEIA